VGQGNRRVKKLHYQELYALYCSPDVLYVVKSRMRLPGHIARMGGRSGPYRILVGRSEGKKQLGRPKYIWEGNIEISLQEVVWGGMDWIDLALDLERWQSLVNAVMNIWVYKMWGISWLAEGLSASQEGFWCID